MFCRTGRPWQLATTVCLRFNIAAVIFAPILFFLEGVGLLIIIALDFVSVVDTVNKLTNLLPIFPFLLSAVCSLLNILLTSPENREKMTNDYRNTIDQDEEMLLMEREMGVPEVIGDSFGENVAKVLLDQNLNPLFRIEIICFVIDIILAIPWIRALI